LDENTGDILWEKSFFGMSGYSSVTVADDKVFVCGHLTFLPISWLYVFDADNGDLLWRKTLWGYIETTPVVYDNKVFVAPGKVSPLLLTPGLLPKFSGNSRIFAFNIDNGQKIWMKQVKGHLIQCSPVAANGKLFIPSNIIILNKWNCRLYALDADTGEDIWYHNMNQEKGAMWPSSISTPSVAYGKVFVTDSDGWLRVWDQESGDLFWKKEIYPDDPGGCCDAFVSPVVVDGKVIVGASAEFTTRFNELFMFNESSGDYIWSIRLDEKSGAPFIVSNEMLFVSDGWNYYHGLNGIYAFG
jgi:outer membrane protein assembly factor BamB